MPDINIQATVGICAEYKKTPGARKAEVSVVISPLKVIEEDGKIRIIQGCNLWQSCQNGDCWYSLAALERKMARPGK